jgi:methyl-accepting chemotaxis protein
MAEAPRASGAPSKRHQRKLRNYLLDRRFQLKYAGYLVGIAVVLSVALGAVLWRTSTRLLAQSQELVALGSAVVAEGRKVSQVVEMNIVKDPEYAQDPELLAAFRAGDNQYTSQLEARQAELARQAAALRAQHVTLAYVLAGALLVFVLFVGLAGIAVTHRVAGPIYKMRRQIAEVAEGRLQPGGRLRRGDELVGFFEDFEQMVARLRERQERQVAALDACLAQLGASVSEEALAPLREVREQMRAALDR